MKNIILLLIISSLNLCFAEEESEILEDIKRNIAPVELKDDEVSINYEMPRNNLNITLGESIKQPSTQSKLIDLKPTEFNIQSLLEKAYKAWSLGSLEASIVYYKQALETDNKNINAIFALGSLYQKLNQASDAIRMYKELFKLEPNHASAINNYVILISNKTPRVALDELLQLERINPKYSPVKAQIGIVYYNLGNFVMAEEYLLEAINLSPQTVAYRYNLAVLYEREGFIEQALAFYRQILIGSDITPELYNNLRNRINILQGQLLTTTQRS